ncbi:unnamed protein product [Ceutorhynchus assimilis]|uniref:Uncharacterized protein n=1 Tax=Ceutorhynchus assimilis TaxID=467358 RepID=A0A9P0DLN9_9CUCU|nr:unnamed protein product [Ceutorhynchus assimilis]
MPPVRWKLLIVTAILSQVQVDAHQMQDSISMSSDGWRPIIGTGRQATKNKQEINQYANPDNFEIIPAEVSNIETTTSPFKVSGSSSATHATSRQGVKQQFKTTNPYFLPQEQKRTVNQQFKKVVKKVGYAKPRKPIRGQVLSHSNRNEIFVPAPSQNAGGFAHTKNHQNNIKTREAQGFGLIGNNFGISQQNAHIELARFPLTGESILQRPTFFLARPLQNDEFTRNLVPPPRSRLPQQKSKDTKISLYAFKEGGAITDATANIPQFGGRPNQFLPQVSPTFDFNTQQQKPIKSQQTKGAAIDVQVTKENLKQYTQQQNISPAAFGTIPGRNNFPIGFVDYEFQKNRPQTAPNAVTYEVTEGKWLDTVSQQYQFQPPNQFIQFQNYRQQPTQQNARPGLLFQPSPSGSTGNPPVFQAPLVDINVPTFLPTPYKSEPAIIPTSPTQSEVATVFTQVSKKMNKYRNQQLQENPLIFDIKEVSTHYPILGTPNEAQSEGSTDLPINENGEISNEITTPKEHRTRRPTKEPTTKSTSTRDPTKSRINRRRPRPRKPSTTTTTEEPVVETYEPIKSQEVILEESVPIENGRPQKRRRPKPTAYIPESEEERTPVNEAVEETTSKKRGKYRFRSRDRPSTERSDTIQRKRLRPAHTENLLKNQQKHSFDETTETSIEYSYERDSPSLEQSYSQESSQSDESSQIQNNESQRFEMPTPVHEQHENKPFIEEIGPITERAPTTTTTEQESHTIFHIPDNNEVDFTTQEVPKDDFITTTAQPTATNEVSTIKSTRIRKPNKFDNSNRPRFSVKEYRQRLNQYSSTPASSTTNKSTQENNLRLRFPSRLRTRPSATSSTSNPIIEDVNSEATTTRSRFRPKDPRHHQTNTEIDSDDGITENSIKSVNPKFRSFGKTKTTTEATTPSSKISIRPNLFSARRRAGYPSLKNRIQNRLNKKNDTDEELQTTTESDVIEEVEPLNAAESATTELSTSTNGEFVVDVSHTQDMKNEDFLYSQRVSDLTSSFKDYDKPGLFNSVSPTSRSIPNYFTISTDDPILPIEAFFPKLKEKNKER